MIYEKINGYLNSFGVELSNKRLVAGFSGGPDSMLLMMYLLYMREKSGVEFKAVHLNHMERETADREEAFVKNFCEANKIEYGLYREDIYLHPDTAKKGFEMCAREKRRELFIKEMALFKGEYILTGHNCDDRIETFFINSTRGAGIKGLSSMKTVNGVFLKPLIFLEKKEISAFLNAEGIEYIYDETNENREFRRNGLRKMIADNEDVIFSHGKKSLLRTLDMLQETDALLTFLTEDLKKKLLKFEKGSWVLDISTIINYNNILFKGILNYTISDLYNGDERFINEIVKLAKSKKSSGKVSKENFLVRKEYNKIFIYPKGVLNEKPVDKNLHELKENSCLEINGYKLSMKREKYSKDECCDESCAFFSLKAGDTFYIRVRKNGDRFIPFGHTGEAKLKDFFIERKIPVFERNMLPLVLDEKGQIIYIAGVKRSGLYKAESGKECIKIYVEKS